ncbi:MAG: aromatic ring-hydroxylating dioxygenase subunit alpha [Gammaproteobacteria bacterium]|nr:aromatic ring-hydroxylating dioxygenase subunit alpha [Gammaproteobacteria bacterium]MCY4227086.1 aromatic ring-hydroxylating dioxygenase subunit alpha [Gammaproteobacteria bacterium]
MPTRDFLPLESLDSVFLPIEKASGLPNQCYTDTALFDFERNRVMARNWVAIAFEHALQANSVHPIDFMGIPILLARSKHGQIRVFHNVCSHRGMRLVSEPRKISGLITCQYHAWTYSADGDLVATPNIGGIGINTLSNFECSGKGLKEIRSHIWMGVIFINLDGQAPAFEQAQKPAIQRTQELIGQSGEREMRASQEDRIDMVINCNWKLVAENYLEAYHLPVIHPALNRYSPLKDHHCRIYGQNMAGQWTTTFNPTLSDGNHLPLFSDWNPETLMIGEYPVIYPNLLMGIQANHVFLGILHPLDVDQTREEFQIFYCEDESLDKPYEKVRAENLLAWSRVFQEDVEPCERMQAGRQSPGYTGGSFSPALDVCAHHFHQWIASHYRPASENVSNEPEFHQDAGANGARQH